VSDFATYKELLQSGENSPAWLLKPKGAAWLGGMGALKDATLERLKAAVKLRFASRAPSDGLAGLGDERVLERAPGDTDRTYAARLVDAWNLWRFGGTALGLLTALRDLGYTTAIVAIANGLAFSLGSGGALVTTVLPAESWACGASFFWSKFVVFLPANPWGVDPSDSDPRVELLRRTVRRWKSAHATCSDIAVLDAGRLWDWPIVLDDGVTPREWDNQGGTWSGATVLHFTP
jgi:hypothetical protein